MLSQPSWAAWIEIYTINTFDSMISSRSPLGLRGLKWPVCAVNYTLEQSQPSWAAWIEIPLLGLRP